MKITSALLASLTQSIENSTLGRGDSEIEIPPSIVPIMPLGGPLSFPVSGQTVSGGILTSVTRAITNAVGQTDILAKLTKGVWRVTINFGSFQDFPGVAAGSKVVLIDSLTLQQQALLQAIAFTNIPVHLSFSDTLFVPQQGLTISVSTSAAGVAQNTVTVTSLLAQKLL